MAFSGGRIPGASGPPGVGPVSQHGSLVLRGRRSAASRLQGRAAAVDRGHSVRRGSEQRTLGHPSLAGSRGGGGKRDSPRPNDRAIPGVRPFIRPPSFSPRGILALSERCGYPCAKNMGEKAGRLGRFAPSRPVNRRLRRRMLVADQPFPGSADGTAFRPPRPRHSDCDCSTRRPLTALSPPSA